MTLHAKLNTTTDPTTMSPTNAAFMATYLDSLLLVDLQLPISLRCWCFSDTSAFDKISEAGEAAP